MPQYFHTDPIMDFPIQQDELLSQYYAAPYQSTSQPQYSSVEAQSLPAQAMWNNNAIMDAFAQNAYYETSQPLQPSQVSLPPQQSPSFWAASASISEEPTSYLPAPTPTPAFSFSPAPLQDEFSYTGSSISSLSGRHSRGLSFASVGSYTSTTGAPSPNPSESNFSRSSSPGAADLSAYGYLNQHGTWSCAYPGCTSRAVFTRGCDLRKHHKRHTKSFFCRYPGCSQASGGGFSSKKDLARHEAKHNPGVVCEWDGCDRVFSRVDNMRDHCKRIHLKAARRASGERSRAHSHSRNHSSTI
ncbi:hypothetical protein EJ08DRAFT_650342 [Tothia fuscella]|uniref:C2H2-type domain-containing protein n=1 Tax=Tothia fuscella TaxID=1048955 RepID=A0A9P4NQL7_9PEZI|nr:hypothetical protein EJ08DRAFT_650342 [Tothia fuscella]